LLYWVIKAILKPVARVLYRPWVEGMENLPRKGPVILAANHVSFLDSIFVPLVLPRRITYVAKADYWKRAWTRWFFAAVRQIPMPREGGEASERALRAGMRVLRSGEILGIYPEGTRSPDGRLYRGKTGVARLAIRTGVPVVPVGVIGTRQVMPPGKYVPRLSRVGVRIGKPLDFKRYAGRSGDHFALRSATDEVVFEIMLLCGQTYCDEYADVVKKAIAGSRSAAIEALASAIPRARPGYRARPRGRVETARRGRKP